MNCKKILTGTAACLGGTALVAAGATAFLLAGRRNHPELEILKKYRYAHRGFHQPGFPENSMAAYRLAIARDWGCELDVHLLKDGTLAIMHDSHLNRTAGVDGIIEELTGEELAELRLEGTEEHVPLFDEVLDLFENKTPLIIELKVWKDNYKELAEAVCKRLDSYRGDFCLESFDPRAVAEIRKLRPEYVRGQLSCDYRKEPGTYGLKEFLMTNLLTNVCTRPDFIAYDVKHRKDIPARKICTDLLKIQEVSWTIRSKAILEAVEEDGSIPIFEKFDPEL